MRPHCPKFLHRMIFILSYLSALLLVMQPNAAGIIRTLILFLLGLAWIVGKKRQFDTPKVSLLPTLSAAFFAFSLGLYFYDQWSPSTKVQSVAAIFHVDSHLLTAITAVCLSVCAAWFMSLLLQSVMNLLMKISEKSGLACILLYSLIAAVVTVLLAQALSFVSAFSMGFLNFFFGVLIVALTILSVYSLFRNICASILLGTGLFMILSTVNVYVYNFRGRLFEPVDLFSFGTAMNVASNYSLFPVPHIILICCGIWIGLLLFVFHACAQVDYIISGKPRILLVLCCLIGAGCIGAYTANLQTYHWNKEGAKINGFVLDYVSKIKEAYIQAPNGYHSDDIDHLSQFYSQKEQSSDTEKKVPHIIVIMDEAFSDLNVLGEIKTNTAVTPFLDSLKQDTISGYVLTSVYGGNTANSEYEFLTGNSMSALSPNAVPYQQYLNAPAYSMVSYLKGNYGYNCIAMHPYLSSSWNRPNTYANFGFDDCIFIEDFPQKQYIRDFISDQEMFEEIVSVYENRQESPLFLFGVSMQNHGGYTYEGEDFIQSISLIDPGHEFPEVEQYLSLIHETDNAVEYLISYFQNAEDDVLIVFFGDHQPKLSDEFYTEAEPANTDSPDSQQKRYKVPFFIWANYDIEEAYVPCTSLNYLSNYVYHAAGIPLPAYNQFLAEMEENIPAINTNGFYSLSSQRFLSFGNASEEEQAWLNLYSQLQYNSLFDTKNRNNVFFPVLE